MKGLFHAPIPPCLSSLSSLLCDLSAFFTDNDVFPDFSNALKTYTRQNELKDITLLLSFGETCLEAWDTLRDDFISVFSSGIFTEGNFPSMERLTIIGKTYEELASPIWQRVEMLSDEVQGLALPYKAKFRVQAAKVYVNRG